MIVCSFLGFSEAGFALEFFECSFRDCIRGCDDVLVLWMTVMRCLRDGWSFVLSEYSEV